jgi:hypothetical protein
MNHVIDLSISLKNGIGILVSISLNLYNVFGRLVIFPILMLPSMNMVGLSILGSSSASF